MYRILKQKKKGFLSVATLLVMLAMISIVLALLYRATNDLSLMKSARDGAKTYQLADTAAETLLNKMRDFDNSLINGTAVNGRIPENTPASTFCVSPGTLCYDYNGVTVAASINDIHVAKVVASDAGNKTRRALNVNIPQRITNQASGLKIDGGSCATGVTISWQERRRKISIDAGAPKDPRAEVSGFSLRMSTTSNIATPNVWIKLKDASNNPITDPAIAANFSTDDAGTYRQTLTVASTNFSSGNTYYFIIKEKNTQPFHLDSPYTNPSDGAKIICP